MTYFWLKTEHLKFRAIRPEMKAVDQHILMGCLLYFWEAIFLSTNIVFPNLDKKMRQWKGTFYSALIWRPAAQTVILLVLRRNTNLAGRVCRGIASIKQLEETPALAFAESENKNKKKYHEGLFRATYWCFYQKTGPSKTLTSNNFLSDSLSVFGCLIHALGD